MPFSSELSDIWGLSPKEHSLATCVLQAEGSQGYVLASQGIHNLAGHAFATAYRLASEAHDVRERSFMGAVLSFSV